MSNAQPDPNNRDWTELPENEAVDQAVDLPETTGIVLDKTVKLLDNKRDFDTWLNSASLILEARGLERLIDINIPRPRRDDPNAPRWLKHSRQVQQWLAGNMSDAIFRNIRAQGKRVELADEFVELAKCVLRDYGPYTDIETVSTFLSMNRSDHATTRQFVAAFETQYTRLESRVDISAYLAMCIILSKLNTEENKEIVAFAAREIKKSPIGGNLWRDFTLPDFRKICFDIRLKLENKAIAKNHQRDQPQVTQPQVAQPGPASQRKLRPTDRGRKAPPPDVDAYEYAKAWSNSPPQKTGTGECAYCEDFRHKTSNCWYINHVRRPRDWKPTLNLWVYEPFSNIGKGTMEDGFSKEKGDPNSKDGSNAMATSFLTGHNVSTTSASVKEEPPKSVTPQGIDLDTPYSFLLSPGRWIVDASISQHICADRTSFIDYHEYDHVDTPFEWVNPAGKRSRAHGTGKVIIGLLLANGRINDFIIECVYHPDCRLSRFSPAMAKKDLNIGYNGKTLALHDLVHDNKVVGHAIRENGIPVLRTSSCLVKREPPESAVASSLDRQSSSQKDNTLLGSDF